MVPAIIVGVIILIVIVFIWGTYNGLVRTNERVNEAWSDITVQLLERIESNDTVELYYRILNETGEIALKNGYVKAEK